VGRKKKAPKGATWLTVLTSGLAVAIFGFVADKVWQMYSHHSLGPRYVKASLRIEQKTLYVFVRNNSDDPLDLIRATIDIDDPELRESGMLGAYPDVSKIYTVSPTLGEASLEKGANGLVVQLKIIQAIPPKGLDHFGVVLAGLLGPLDLSRAKIKANIEDIKGNSYPVVR
jgi:hypothetical protein